MKKVQITIDVTLDDKEDQELCAYYLAVELENLAEQQFYVRSAAATIREKEEGVK